MPGTVRLSRAGLNGLIDNVRASGGDPSELLGLLAEIEAEEAVEETSHNPIRAEKKKLPLKVGAAELDARIEEAREEVEQTEGECMICQKGPVTLYAGTCEDCFREWMLSVMQK